MKTDASATERVVKNVPRAVLFRFTVPPRRALIWQWLAKFRKRHSASESLWTCSKWSLWDSRRSTSVQQGSKSHSILSFCPTTWGLHPEFVACWIPRPVCVAVAGLQGGLNAVLCRLAWIVFTANGIFNRKSTFVCLSPFHFLCAQIWSLSYSFVQLCIHFQNCFKPTLSLSA